MRQRDQEEFERVFRSAYRSVLLTASLVLQDRGRAEEVTQDAFLRLYERWGGAVVFEHPAAWVRRVAVRDAIRRAKRERVVPVDLEDLPVDQVAELLQVAPATVRQHLFKARCQLAEHLGETVEEVVGDADR